MCAKWRSQYESLRFRTSHLLLIGGVDSVEFAQQGRPFDFGWFSIAANGAIIGGGDGLVVDRVKRGTRLLEGELHRASPLHAIGRQRLQQCLCRR
jgi:hypothetical protein